MLQMYYNDINITCISEMHTEIILCLKIATIQLSFLFLPLLSSGLSFKLFFDWREGPVLDSQCIGQMRQSWQGLAESKCCSHGHLQTKKTKRDQWRQQDWRILTWKFWNDSMEKLRLELKDSNRSVQGLKTPHTKLVKISTSCHFSILWHLRPCTMACLSVWALWSNAPRAGPNRLHLEASLTS